MAQQPFTWPNKARLAFVLGIAFEAWDRSKPTTGRGLQRGLDPRQRGLQARLLHGDVSRVRRQSRFAAAAGYLRSLRSQSQHADQRIDLRVLPGAGQGGAPARPRDDCPRLGSGRVPLHADPRTGARQHCQNGGGDYQVDGRTTIGLVISWRSFNRQHARAQCRGGSSIQLRLSR